MFKKKQSVNQDFINSYSRIIRINTQFKLHCTHQYIVEVLNQFYQDYLKLNQSFNLIQCAVQEQIKMIRKRFKKKRHNQFYTGSPTGLLPVFSAQLAEKVPLTQLIVDIQLINQFLLLVEISTLLN